jgi:hypothetical protein
VRTYIDYWKKKTIKTYKNKHENKKNIILFENEEPDPR